VKRVSVELNAKYQEVAAGIAEADGIERVHFDAYWWKLRRE
jgi:hypothetical protein